MKKLQKRMFGLICLLLVSALIAGCGGGSKKGNGDNNNPPAGGFNRTFVETFDKITGLTDIKADRSLLDNPTSFSTAYMPDGASVYAGREVGTLGLDNGDAMAQGVNGLRIGFTVPGLKDAPAPVLKLKIKNTSDYVITLLVGNEYRAGGNAGESGQRAHAVLDIPAKSDYTEYPITLNTSFKNTELIQLRPTVLDGSNKATSNGAAGLYVDKIEVTGLPDEVTEPEKYTLETNVTGSGTISVSPEGGNYDANTSVTLTATAEAGWKFDHWSGDLTGSVNPATLTMNANKTVTAVFVEESAPPVKYTLTVNKTGQGDVALNPSGGNYDAGTTVTLTATAASGWKFKQWTGDASGTATTATVTMNADKTVTAVFEEDAAPSVIVLWKETFDKVPNGTNLKNSTADLDNPGSFNASEISGTLSVTNGEVTMGTQRVAFTTDLSQATHLLVTIKNPGAVANLTLCVGDSYSTGGNVGETGLRAHGQYFVANTEYVVLEVTLEPTLKSSNKIQFRGMVDKSSAAGLIVTEIQVVRK